MSRFRGIPVVLLVATLSALCGETPSGKDSVSAPETVQAFLMFYGQLKLGIDPASLPSPEPAAAAEKNLDSTGGHKDAEGNYHFHATVSTADFTSGKTKEFKLTYKISGKPRTIHYTLQDDAHAYKFEITESDGAKRTETYPRKARRDTRPDVAQTLPDINDVDPKGDFSAPPPLEMLDIVRGGSVPRSDNRLLNTFVSRYLAEQPKKAIAPAQIQAVSLATPSLPHVSSTSSLQVASRSYIPPNGNGNLMAASFAPFKPQVRYDWDSATFYLQSDGAPDRTLMPAPMVGISSWQQHIPLPISYFAGTTNPEKDAASLGYGKPNVWTFPLVPAPSASPIAITASSFNRGAIAIAANGSAIFNPHNNTGALSYEKGELDAYGGHCGAADDYHYHIIPTHLSSRFGGKLGDDVPIAWSLDGYPYYGFLEPDGTAQQALDSSGGHSHGIYSYHYHAVGTKTVDASHPFGTPQSPYTQTAFHGTVVYYGSQVDGQPEVGSIRSSPSGGFADLPVSGASIVAFKNPVALSLSTDANSISNQSGAIHLTENTSGMPSPDSYLMRVSINGTTYDECWKFNRAVNPPTVTVTWRLANTVITVISTSGGTTTMTLSSPATASGTGLTLAATGSGAPITLSNCTTTLNSNTVTCNAVTGVNTNFVVTGTNIQNANTTTTTTYVSVNNRILPYSVAAAWTEAKLPDTSQTLNVSTAPQSQDSNYTINAQSFTDNGDGTITDNVTGLMWQKTDNGESTWPTAVTNAGGITTGGYTDWRLPTPVELQSIQNYNNNQPALNTTYFSSASVTISGATTNGTTTVTCASTAQLSSAMSVTGANMLANVKISSITNSTTFVLNTAATGSGSGLTLTAQGGDYWWSSDPYYGSTTNVWCVNGGGGMGPKALTETLSAGGPYRYCARYVRGAKPTNGHNYLNNGDGTITDTDTGLMWTQLPFAATTWTSALSTATSLTTGGYSDWRLPNVKEMGTLTDYTLTAATTTANILPSIDRTLFAKTLTNCATTSGSTTVTCADTTGLLVGMPLVDYVDVSGTYISSTARPTVASVTNSTTFVMSAAALATGSGRTLRALVPPTAYWTSTIQAPGSSGQAWLVETGINNSVPSGSGPTRNAQGIISYEIYASTYPAFAVRTTSVATQIAVEQPSGTALTDGVSNVNFGTVNVGSTATKTFVIRNNGSTSLQITGVTIDGTNAANYSVTTSPASSIAAGGNTTMVVQFNATSAGSKLAALHIASSDTSVGAAFDVTLSGVGYVPPPTITSVTATPAAPTSTDSPYITAQITPGNGATISQALLTYSTGAQVTAPAFQEVFANASTVSGLSGSMNSWTTTGFRAVGDVRLTGGSNNHTAAIVLSNCTTNGTTTVTCSSTTGLIPGMSISGTNIAASTTIASVTNSTTFVLGTAATGSGTGLSLTAAGVTLTGCTTTSASTTVTCLSTTGLAVGMGVTGVATNPPNPTIATITPPTTFTLNNAVTSGATGVTLTATGCGLAFSNGTTNYTDTMAATTNAINAGTATAGYVEFYVQSANLVSNNGWTFQISPDGGTSWNTRLSESFLASGSVNCTLNNANDQVNGSTTILCTNTSGLTVGYFVQGSPITIAGCTTSSTTNPTVVLTANTGSLAIGMFVSGAGNAGIPPNARITAISPGVSFTMSAGATVTASNVSLLANYLNANTTISSITPNVSFVVNNAAFYSGSGVTLSSVNHGFTKMHYDLVTADMTANMLMRFQFSGYNGVAPNRPPTVNIDDITVILTTGAAPVTVTMYDDGLHGDGVTGDGVYGAQIPAQAVGTIVTYSIAATDSNASTTNLSPAGNYTVVAAGTPTANAQSVNVAFNTATSVTLTGSDPNVPAQTLTYSVTASPSHGTLSGTAPNLTYTPTTGYSGTDSFQFTAKNTANATSSAATVSLTVAAALNYIWTGGTGTWSVGTVGWDKGAWVDNNNAVIGQGTDSAGTISVSGTVNPNSITFNAPLSGTYTLAVNGTVTAGGPITAGAGVILRGTGGVINRSVQTAGTTSVIWPGSATLGVGVTSGETLTLSGLDLRSGGKLKIAANSTNAQQLILSAGAACNLTGSTLSVGVTAGSYSKTYTIVDATAAGNVITATVEPTKLLQPGVTVQYINASNSSSTTLVGHPSNRIQITLGAVTPITIASFAATQEGAGVQLAWHCVSEYQNVGFNVYRREIQESRVRGQESDWMRVNPALIAGRLTTPDAKTYRLYDWAPSGMYEYKLESIDLHGATQTYRDFAGPVTLDALAEPPVALSDDGMEAAMSSAVDESKRALGCALQARFAALPDTVINGTVRAVGLNDPGPDGIVKAASRAADELPMPPAMNPVASVRWFTGGSINASSSFTAAKVQYSQAGVLLIPQNVMPVGFDIAHVAIQREGRSLTALVRTPAGLLVYGAGYSDDYTDKDALFLRTIPGATAAGAVTQASGLFESAQPAATTSPATVAAAYHDVYFDYDYRPFNFEPWFSSKYLTSGTDQAFNLDAPNANGGGATLTVNLWSLAPGDGNAVGHALQISVNNLPVGQTQWSSSGGMIQLSFQIPAGLLNAGTNAIDLITPQSTDGSNPVSFLHSMTLSYTRTLKGSLPTAINTTTATPTLYEIAQLAGANVWVVDARFPDRAALVPYKSQLQADGTFKIRFNASGGGTGQFIVVPMGQENRPISVARASVKPIKGTPYLAVGPSQFSAGVQPLLMLRSKEGLRGAFVDQAQLFDYYNYGRYGPAAIQKAVRSTRPQYLLLLGRTTYDYHNYSGANVDPLCPAFLVSTTFWAQTTSDSMFGDLGRGYPEVAVGRLPVNNTSDLSVAVQHVLSYGGAPLSGIRVNATTDQTDPAVADFPAQAAELSRSFPDMTWQANYLGVTYQTPPEVTGALTVAANGGADWLLYIGHGNAGHWGAAKRQILGLDDIPNWTGNGVLLQSTCTANWMAKDEQNYRSIAIQALTQPQGGISASIGTSTYMNSDYAVEFMHQLMKNANVGGMRWGNALMKTQQWAALQGASFYTDLSQTEQLFGDPAMPVFMNGTRVGQTGSPAAPSVGTKQTANSSAILPGQFESASQSIVV
ncbi:MAG: C25 family cysteine peptidase [Planctomycetota bacterium]